MAARRKNQVRMEGGQATLEYVGLLLLAATVMAVIVTLVVPAVPGVGVARAVAAKLVCAVKGDGACGGPPATLAGRQSPLEEAYGAELTALLGERLPAISFEDGDFVSLPVDFRECRERACSDSILHGSLEHTQTGLEPTAFTHVVDCRDPGLAAESGSDCSGERAGHVYLQYWLYYPDSRTGPATRITGGYHKHDWESYQVRIDPDGDAVARASSHHSYNGRSGGIGSIPSDAGWDQSSGWDTVLGQLHVAAGSHAGTSQAAEGDTRRIEPADLRLIPLEAIAEGDVTDFGSITPPWAKGVWTDPESTGT